MSDKIELSLKNIRVIKEAVLDISGLTVIAGKNDRGKTTVGKALMALIKSNNRTLTQINSKSSSDIDIEELSRKNFNKMVYLLFDSHLSLQGNIFLSVNGKEKYGATIYSNQCKSFKTALTKNNRDKEFIDCTFIQSPLIWDLEEFFNTVSVLKQNDSIYDDNFEIKYPYILWDLYAKFNIRKLVNYESLDSDVLIKLQNDIRKIIGGHFMKEQGKTYNFYPTNDRDIPINDRSIPITNVAMGIKSFGIIQVLLDVNCFTPQGFFVFDEPENHLHPTWQLEFAKIIITLVQSGIRIMINTHSPYMLQALELYSRQNGNIKYSIYHTHRDSDNLCIFDNVSNDLSPIYKDLLTPIDELDFIQYKLSKKTNE